MELDKIYDPKAVEEKWYKDWEKKGYFRADAKSSERSYSIVIPPPNVTGSLHMGHALNNTIQDILARYKRMQGYDVLWLPGMDHAGIATQNVVEKMLHKEGLSRDDIGREAFVERVWKWKEESGGSILNQLKRLGSSCDWSRERFTMDEGLSKAVREVFVRLYEEGLIYRDERLINWCPRCLTALSDIEVEHEDTDGALYHIKYPVFTPHGSSDQFEEHHVHEYLIVATTRPETMLGDTAVAVHPEDKRFNHLIGKEVMLPLTNRRIPIIADTMVDMEFGTGAVKITPAHDFNDFEAGNRHGLKRINILTDRAHLKGDVEGIEPEVYAEIRDLHAHKVREKVVHILRERGLLTKGEPHKHAVGKCYRCRTVVEPYLSPQWYVKIAPLAEPAVKAVEEGKTKFIPKNWENTYFEWMRNIKDWCISRQIWWGHQIPAWYCVDCNKIEFVRRGGEATPVLEPCNFGDKGAIPVYTEVQKKDLVPIVSRTAPATCPKCGSSRLIQDEDVLDTWFSSGLWPFSTLGWPEKTDELRRYYPTSTLVTGFDIIFFWVARMMMMGIKFMGDVPFRNVYIHALVRDAQGQKMSKSKGNVIDPLVIMEKYGTDAFRFTLAAMAAQGRDVKLSEERIEGYRNFANKIWNAARFSMMNLADYDPENVNPGELSYSLADRWIVMRTNNAIKEVLESLESYRFNDAANAAYHFVWHELCDWYIEISKPALQGKLGSAERKAAQHVLYRTVETAMRLLHPFMPFITEEIWQTLTQSGAIAGGRIDRKTGFVDEGSETPSSIMTADYPMYSDLLMDAVAEKSMEVIIETTKAARNLRAELNVPPSAAVDLIVFSDDQAKRDILSKNEGYLKNLAKVGKMTVSSSGERPRGAATAVVMDMEILVIFEKSGEALKEEAERLKKELAKVEKELAQVQGKLNNSEFTGKAPQQVIEKEKGKEAELLAAKAKLEEGIKRAEV